MLLAFINTLRVTVTFRLTSIIPLLFELWISLERIGNFLLLENISLNGLESIDMNSGNEKSVKEIPSKYPELYVRGSLKAEEGNTFPESVGANQNFTDSDEDFNPYKFPRTCGGGLSVVDLSCRLNGPDGQNLLRDVSFEISDWGLTVITGQVGSGKSTLLAALAGEVITSSGKITCTGTVAYVSQTAWVFSGTFRENVLFGEPYDEKKYAKVIQACALIDDINRFPNGDLVFVGEHGVVLSGGQRARVNLARAVYADADVYLLDDPLSAVDSKVGDHIFSQCICDLLHDKIKVMVTYSEKHMKEADQIVVLHSGSVLGKGTFSELRKSGKILDTIIDPFISMKKNTSTQDELAHLRFEAIEDSFNEHLEVSEEDKVTGKISPLLYWDYFRAGMHSVGMALLFLLFLITQGTPIIT